MNNCAGKIARIRKVYRDKIPIRRNIIIPLKLNNEFPQDKHVLRHAAEEGRQIYGLTFGYIF